MAVHPHANIAGTAWDFDQMCPPARPTNIYWRDNRIVCRLQNLHGAILRPPTRPVMNLTRRPWRRARQSNRCPHGIRISDRAFQPDAKSRVSPDIPVELCLRRSLSYHQIQATVLIIIANRSAPLFARNFKAAPKRGRCRESPFPIPSQKKSPAIVVSRCFRG